MVMKPKKGLCLYAVPNTWMIPHKICRRLHRRSKREAGKTTVLWCRQQETSETKHTIILSPSNTMCHLSGTLYLKRCDNAEAELSSIRNTKSLLRVFFSSDRVCQLLWPLQPMLYRICLLERSLSICWSAFR